MPEHLLIANGKGGVGKTSVAVNLAAIWAAAGRRVLLIDTDPQGNAAVHLGLAEHDSGRSLHLAVIGGTAANPVVGVRDNLDLVPGGDELDALNAALAARQARHRHGALDTIVAALHATGASYDLVLIDTAPAGGVLIDGLINAADWVLIPTKPDELSLLGLARVATRVGELADQGRPARPAPRRGAVRHFHPSHRAAPGNPSRAGRTLARHRRQSLRTPSSGPANGPQSTRAAPAWWPPNTTLPRKSCANPGTKTATPPALPRAPRPWPPTTPSSPTKCSTTSPSGVNRSPDMPRLTGEQLAGFRKQSQPPKPAEPGSVQPSPANGQATHTSPAEQPKPIDQKPPPRRPRPTAVRSSSVPGFERPTRSRQSGALATQADREPPPGDVSGDRLPAQPPCHRRGHRLGRSAGRRARWGSATTAPPTRFGPRSLHPLVVGRHQGDAERPRPDRRNLGLRGRGTRPRTVSRPARDGTGLRAADHRGTERGRTAVPARASKTIAVLTDVCATPGRHPDGKANRTAPV